ncbi:MAG: shikimate kinase [Halobacteriaceae archaeon]
MVARGAAAAPGAGTVLNALATGVGSAFAIDRTVQATVELAESGPLDGRVAGDPDADTTLIERCVERTVAEVAPARTAAGMVETESDLPMAGGLKSSSAAANATVLATLDALGAAEDVSRLAATRIGVAAARDAGVTVTGAFDDATASMLGGLTVTDNTEDELLAHEPVDWAAAVWTPPERARSAEADVERCRQVAPIADHVADLALAERYGTAMTVNGFAFCAALERPTEPLLEAMPAATGVSLSGTGPSYVAVGDPDDIETVLERWRGRPGTAWQTTTRIKGATTT